MIAKTIHLPVFSPNRFEKAQTVMLSQGCVWSVTEETTYQYDTMPFPVTIKAGHIRGVPWGVSQVGFDRAVAVEIQQ